MFYSQFILAKKGPLGTIWIAAHLERKLRKNQVADTDIGVSVDSILSPDVPIALRLSSHLLLGVVRIYSRKVNYLFDDCSEALLKIKQAFRSTAVDLPPEESTAPYHSITLPETFDLDDFELPDSDAYQGNYVDHHVSSKDQITLQDTMDGVVYSTSQFGLDERFGDGDTSGLDLDEELFMSKVAAAGHDDLTYNSRNDPQSSVQPMESFGHEDNNKMIDNSEIVITSVDKHITANDGDASHIEYDQAPRTPGLLGEPNLSNIQETSACDDHLEFENQNLTEFAVKENIENANCISDIYLANKNEVNGSFCSGVDPVPVLSISEKDNSFLANGLESTQQNAQGELSTVESSPLDNDISDKTELIYTVQIGDHVQSFLPSDALKTNVGSSATSEHEKSETQDRTEQSKDSLESVDLIQESVACTEDVNQIEASVPPNLPSEVAGSCLDALEKVDDPSPVKLSTVVEGEEYHEDDGSKQAVEGHHAAALVPCDTLNDQADNVNAVDGQLKVSDSSVVSYIPAPEKLLSVPEVNLLDNLSMGATPGQMFAQIDGGNDTSLTIIGKKRSFTESELTMQSLNSVDSLALNRRRTTPESVPDDDDLLSSILVGRKTSALKVKETPQHSLPYLKRHKSAPRSSAFKRKVLMDEQMVLHGDMIRQQLTNTEDIRRLRKKAPCTRPEILMIQKQFLEDDMFGETIFTGISLELASMHNQAYDLGETMISLDDVTINNAASAIDRSITSSKDKAGALVEVAKDMDLYDEFDSRVASIGRGSDIMKSKVNDNAQIAEATLLVDSQQNDGQSVSLDPTFDAAEAKKSEEVLSDTIEMDVEAVNPGATVVAYTSSTVDVIRNGAGDQTASVFHLAADIVNEVDASFPIMKPVEMTEQLDAPSCEIHANVDAVKMDGDVDIAVVHDVETTEVLSGEIETCTSVQVETEVQTHTDGVIPTTMSVDVGECSTLLSNDHVVDETRQDEQALLEEDMFLYAEAEYNDKNLVTGGVYDVEDIINSSDPVMVDMDLRSSINDGNTEEVGIDQVKYDNLDYSAARNDTDFLNYDEDEDAEADDEDVPNAEAADFIDNSGWSSRTRAVAKYLQTLFDKEAERQRNVLPIDNLLAGKSRKEASRMFFETLVLTTKDYIQVEQTTPFNNINIFPRAKLTKVDL